MQVLKNQLRVINSSIKQIRKIPLYFCSNEKKVEVIESDGSWSYELNESIKGVRMSEEGNYAIFYTCKVCETKQSRSFSKNSYHKGVVIIRCEGCQNLHLIADNLGWFEDGKVNIEDLALRNKEKFLKIKPDGKLQEEFLSKMKFRTEKKEEKNEDQKQDERKEEMKKLDEI